MVPTPQNPQHREALGGSAEAVQYPGFGIWTLGDIERDNVGVKGLALILNRAIFYMFSALNLLRTTAPVKRYSPLVFIPIGAVIN